CGDIGVQTVTLIVEDINGNTSNCNADITVEDNVDPTALCQDVTVQLNDMGEGALNTAQVNNGSADACGISILSLDTDEFNCDDVGNNLVTLTVEDVNGNTSTCTSVVTVEDNIAPEALCQDITVELDGNGTASISPSQVDNISTDACGIVGLSLDNSSFGIGDLGDNTVTLTITDENGNMSTCTATVTVEQNVSPTVGSLLGDQPGNTQSGVSNPVNRAMVFPNPTLGDFALRFEQPIEGQAHAILRNDLGQVMAQVVLPAGTVNHQWANVYLSAGMYFIEIRHANGHREILKIVRKQF
ncbi:MAG: T9SS type A sorting domain-containing protein, partial [Mameliella sp.]|nr:T9SS type A sorting domain-containing protein [Phaeodactylibacter sp.]